MEIFLNFHQTDMTLISGENIAIQFLSRKSYQRILLAKHSHLTFNSQELLEHRLPGKRQLLIRLRTESMYRKSLYIRLFTFYKGYIFNLQNGL